jgi:hypothetical protein
MIYTKVTPRTAARIMVKVFTATETAPDVGVDLAVPVVIAVPEDAADPLGAVGVGTEKPVTLPLKGPGGADADAPVPTSWPSDCCVNMWSVIAKKL